MTNATGYLLSIIVPTYNNAEFITDTLTSLHKGITEEVELIIVNDGSTDSTEERINAFYRNRNDNNVKYIAQKNQGVAIARNVGLAQATGKYIGFVDSDDLVSPDYFSVLLPKLREEKYDIIDFNLTRDIKNIHSASEERGSDIIEREFVFSDDKFSSLTPIFRAGQWHLMTKVFHRNIIGEDRFEEHRRYEDMIFCPFQYFKCKKILKIDNNLYYYRLNNKSITENIIEGDAESIFFAMRKMCNFINNNSEKRTVATLMIINCFMEGRKLLRKKKGYYCYRENMINDIQNALACCDNSVISKKTFYKMKYPHLDCYFSKMKFIAKKSYSVFFVPKGN